MGGAGTWNSGAVLVGGGIQMDGTASLEMPS